MSKLHAMLVDDEDFVLEGLRDAIEWESYGIELAETANNGAEALERLAVSEAPIDILITDIKMPVMDGLQLIETLHSNQYPCKMLVLTGHEEFEFAKKAIRFGIFDYLLKPVEIESIHEALLRLSETIREEKERSEISIRVENKLSMSLPLLEEQLLFSMLNGEYQPALLEFIGLPMHSPYYQAIIAYCDPFHHAAADTEAIRQFVCETAQPYGQPFALYYNAKGIIVIMAFQNEDYANCLQPVLNEAGDLFRLKRKVPLYFSYGKLCTAPYLIPKSFQGAREALKNRLFSDDKQEESLDDALENGPVLFPLKERQRLLNAVYAKNEELVEQLLNRHHQDFKKSQALYPDKYMQKISGELIMLLSLILYERNDSLESLDPYCTEQLANLRDYTHPDEVFPPIKRLYKHLVRRLPSSEDKKNRQSIRLCLDYIDNHLDAELRLEDLAQMVYLTPNYLGTLFKEAVGAGFSEYVTQQRMERAKKLLLAPGSRIYEVSQQVGYKNAHYFSKLFKAYTGVKPSNYK